MKQTKREIKFRERQSEDSQIPCKDTGSKIERGRGKEIDMDESEKTANGEQ